MRKRRGIGRVVLRIVAGLLAVSVAGCLIARVQGRRRLQAASTALAQRWGSLDLASYERLEVPPEENAAAWLEAGAGALEIDRETERFVQESSSMPWAQWDAARAKRVRDVLGGSRPALVTLHKAAAAPQASFGIRYGEGTAARVPPLRQIRHAVQLLVLEGRQAAREKDGAGVLAAVGALRGCADALYSEPMLIAVILGYVTETQLLTFVGDVAASPEPGLADADFLRALAEALPREDRRAQLRRAVAREAAVMVDSLRDVRLFLGMLGRGEQETPGFASFAGQAASLGFGEATQAAIVEQALQVMDLTESPLGARPDPPYPEKSLSPAGVASLVAVQPKLARQPQELLAQRQLVALALHLRQIGAQAGSYPDAADLPPGLNQPNPLTGQPLAYARADDGSATVEVRGIENPRLKAIPDARWRKLALPPPRAGSTTCGSCSGGRPAAGRSSGSPRAAPG